MGQMAGFLPLDNGPVKGTAFPTRAGLGWTYHSPAHWCCAMASSCGTTNSNQPTWSLFLGPHPFATFFFFIIIYYFIKYLIKKSKHKHPPHPITVFFLPRSCFPLSWVVNAWGQVWSCPLLYNPQISTQTCTPARELVFLLSSLHRGSAVASVGTAQTPRLALSAEQPTALFLSTEESTSSPPRPCHERYLKCKAMALRTVHLWPSIKQFITILVISLPQANLNKNFNSIKGFCYQVFWLTINIMTTHSNDGDLHRKKVAPGFHQLIKSIQ